ncbi:MAG: LCP family protein [Acidobacteriota bacterium]|nr:LCP family protein [Acidobacteriota bacterium]
MNPRGAAGASARGGGQTYAGRGGRDPQGRPYNTYRSTPRSLGARLRGETDADLEARASELSRQQPPRPPRGGEPSGGGRRGGPGGPGSRPPRGLRRIPGFRPSARPLLHPLRLLRYFVTFCVFWVALSVVLFFVSASGGNLPGGSATQSALASSGPMLFTPNNILVVGLDVRPRSGYSSHEAGSNYSEKNAATDTLMIWRVGGGVSRKLSIPRDTLVYLPSCGYRAKINAAWACGGPKATIQAVEALTHVKINHMIVVSLGNFVKFIDDIGGVTVKTPRICSKISGGAANGGYTLNLSPGTHHLTGIQAITLARTRENSCNLAYNDFNREQEQQQIMSGIKGQLFSAHAFIHLPWASWDAPKAVQTDMGPVTLLQLFGAAEIGGSSKPVTLGGSFGTYNGADVVINNPSSTARKVNTLLNG